MHQQLSWGEQMMPVRPAALPHESRGLVSWRDRTARKVAERLPFREALPEQSKSRRFPLQIGIIDGPVQRSWERLGKRLDPIVSPIRRLLRFPEPLCRCRQLTLRATRVPLGLELTVRLLDHTIFGQPVALAQLCDFALLVGFESFDQGRNRAFEVHPLRHGRRSVWKRGHSFRTNILAQPSRDRRAPSERERLARMSVLPSNLRHPGRSWERGRPARNTPEAWVFRVRHQRRVSRGHGRPARNAFREAHHLCCEPSVRCGRDARVLRTHRSQPGFLTGPRLRTRIRVKLHAPR